MFYEFIKRIKRCYIFILRKKNIYIFNSDIMSKSHNNNVCSRQEQAIFFQNNLQYS